MAQALITTRISIAGQLTRPGLAPLGSGTLAYEWSDSNLPWAYNSTADFSARLPSGTTVVDIQTGSSDFWTNLNATIAAAPDRVVVRLGAGVYEVNSFRKIGGSGSETYAFGFWFPKLQGFIGQGADKTFIQMGSNSYTQAQLDAISSMTTASFAPLQAGLCRIDSTEASPVYLAGLTFRAKDQQMLNTVASDVPSVVPQPAPHQGVVLYTGSTGAGVITHVRFQAAGRAMTSQPPFEMANVTSQGSKYHFYKCEFDGRRSSDFDSSRPRRCGVFMANNELESYMEDCWFHHSNVSRYAVNDQNRDTSGAYTLVHCKSEQITNTQNDGYGGYTNASPFGWESCNGTITLTECIVEQNNPYTNTQIAQHLQLTSVGSRNPQGGRMYVNGGIWRNTGFPSLDGYQCMRITNSFWIADGYDNTIFAYNSSGQRKTAYVYSTSSSWPPSAATLTAAGVSPETHYLVRNG